MTTSQLKTKALQLEEALTMVARNLHRQIGCRIARVEVIEDGPEIHDLLVKVRLAPSSPDLKERKILLEKAIRRLLIEFEEETDFRVSAVVASSESLRVSLDPIPYPQRYEPSLGESPVH